jgi:hypothetical protein
MHAAQQVQPATRALSPSLSLSVHCTWSTELEKIWGNIKFNLYQYYYYYLSTKKENKQKKDENEQYGRGLHFTSGYS